MKSKKVVKAKRNFSLCEAPGALGALGAPTGIDYPKG